GGGGGGGVLVGLAHQLVRECASKGVDVAPQLALEALRLLQVNPQNSLQEAAGSAGPAGPAGVCALLAACMRFLLDRGAPGLAAVRMKIAFRRKYKRPETIAAEQARGTESRVAPLLAEVLEDAHEALGDLPTPTPAALSPVPAPPSPTPAAAKLAARAGSRARATPASVREERADKERLYASVVAAAVLRSGLGSPADPAVIKEASAAMQSVYPSKELPHLLRLPPSARHAQLLEVCRISAGVRIFNWDCRGRKANTDAAHGLLDLPGLVQEAAAVTKTILTASVEGVETRLWTATAALEVVYAREGHAAGNGDGDADSARHGGGGVDPEQLKETVTFLRQQQVLLRRLLEDIEAAGTEARRLAGQLEVGLAEVHAAVQSKTAVPTSQVYPQFMALASTWEALETQAVVVSRAASLHRRLAAYAKGAVCSDDAALRGLLAEAKRAAPTDAERVSAGLTASAGADLQQLEAARRRLDRDLGRGDVVTELEGFCPWFLAVSGGGLVPGCPALGLCEAGGGGPSPGLYALSSLRAAQLFSANPNKWIQRALDEVRRRPAQVCLLGLGDALQLPTLHPDLLLAAESLPGSRAGLGLGAGLQLGHAGVQTEAVRRRAGAVAVHVHLPPVPSARTRAHQAQAAATQTEASSYRRDGCAQTFPARDAAVQCPRSVACTAGPAAADARNSRQQFIM
ncbi:Cilia- and flagella-associated protein 206, partial [Frankliniella fusca]